MTATAALIAGLAMAAAPAFSQDEGNFEKGFSAYELGDYARAVELWEPLAEEGNIDAQRNLAQMYRLGLGVQKDDAKAYALYRKAAELGSNEAQVNVAFQLLTGKGVDQDRGEAATWFARAADAGNPLAQYNLGLMYEKGIGVERNDDFAVELYRLAASKGQKRAIARLEEMDDADVPAEGELGEKVGVAAIDAAKTGSSGKGGSASAEARQPEADDADARSADRKDDAAPAYTSAAEQAAEPDDRPILDVVRTPTRKPGERVAEAPAGDEPTRIEIPEPQDTAASSEPPARKPASSGTAASSRDASENSGETEMAEATSGEDSAPAGKKDYSGTRDEIAGAVEDRVAASDESSAPGKGKDYSGTRNEIAGAVEARVSASDRATTADEAEDTGTKRDYSGTREAIAEAVEDRSDAPSGVAGASGSQSSKDYDATRGKIAEGVAALSDADEASEGSDGSKSADPRAAARMPSDPIARVKMAERAYAEGDFERAAALIGPLARAGMPVAQFWMGRMYNRGEGVERDPTRAYGLWRSASSAGSQRAATALANLASRLSPDEIALAEQSYSENFSPR